MASKNYNKLLHMAEVVQIEDNLPLEATTELERNSLGRRIKAKIIESDLEGTDNDSLPWAFPLLPKHLQVMPNVGERVMLILENLDSPQGNRFYIGPIISQDYFLYNCNYYQAASLIQGLSTRALCNPLFNPKNNGTIPDKETVALQGRGTASLWLKNEEVRLLCGHKPNWIRPAIQEFADPGSLIFNRKSLSYIQMRFGDFKTQELKPKYFESVVNVVADRINLLTHDGIKDGNMIVNDPDDLIPQNSLEYIATNAQKMVYGNKLIAFLEKFRSIYREHTHHWMVDPQVMLEKDNEDFWNKDLNDLLCETIRIQ